MSFKINYSNNEIKNLNKKYKETWGKEIDYNIIPKGITQEKLIKCIHLIIKDNVSLLVAYNKLFNKK